MRSICRSRAPDRGDNPMSTVPTFASPRDAREAGPAGLGYLADMDAASIPAEARGQYIRELVQADAVLTAALAGLLAAYDAKDGHLADGQRSLGAWLGHMPQGPP